MFNLALHIPRNRTSTTSLDNLSQCLTNFRVKNFYLCNLNLLSFSLKSFPLTLILHATIKPSSAFFLQAPFRNAAIRSPLNLLLSRLNKPMNGPQKFTQPQVCTGAFEKGSSGDKLQELFKGPTLISPTCRKSYCKLSVETAHTTCEKREILWYLAHFPYLRSRHRWILLRCFWQTGTLVYSFSLRF